MLCIQNKDISLVLVFWWIIYKSWSFFHKSIQKHSSLVYQRYLFWGYLVKEFVNELVLIHHSLQYFLDYWFPLVFYLYRLLFEVSILIKNNVLKLREASEPHKRIFFT